MKRIEMALVLCWVLAVVECRGITLTAFGGKGEGGSKNGQTLRVGAGGSVYELDGFLYVPSQDLNGSQVGQSAQMSNNGLPAGLVYGFGSQLTNGGTDLMLSYWFTNTSEGSLADLRFFVFVDAEIDEATNTFYNEYGVMRGVLGTAASDGDPDYWQIDEPGFQSGTLFSNLFLGTLNNSNSVPAGAPNDVSMALGFSLGTVKAGDWTSVEVLISEAGNQVGSVALEHRDAASPGTVMTLSGWARTNIPPFMNVTGALQFGLSGWQLNRATGSLLGTLSITNPGGNSVTFAPPYQLGIQASTNFYYRRAEGTLLDGLKYVDVSSNVMARVAGGVLGGGQWVVLTNAVDLYSRYRTAPSNSLFELWATKQ